uniref:RNA-dependent RNA polymerase n=1 Tax=Baoding Narna tick virus 2 TaxID=2972232 RepID=A0A9E7V1X5_9VIRU|nr:MAG: RNA-dependent RNA polymerase [Baoding Narna tick virus 2]
MILDHYRVISSSLAYSSIEECRLYYDRRQPANIIPPSLSNYVKGTHNLYLKQIPSCLTLRKAGSRLSKNVRPFLEEDGFFAQSLDTGGCVSDVLEHWSEVSQVPPSTEEEEDVPELSETDSRDIYEDPFKVLAGYAFASQYLAEKPKINLWPGGCHRLQDKISPTLCGSDRKNVTSFTKIRSHREKMFLIFNHTHWGHMIQNARHSKAGDNSLKNFANQLFRRISFFIRGRHDPLWGPDEISKFADYSENRNEVYRAQRLIEVLKTVDGLFLQRYLSYPEEIWDWTKYDLFTLQAISVLLTDEFFDGEVTDYSLDEQVTHYEDLKRARKLFKQVIHLDEPLAGIASLDSTPRWVQSFLRPVWDRAVRHEGFSRLYLAGTLSQTRGSGTPPPLVVLRSKRKFLRSVDSPPPDISDTHYALIASAMDSVMVELPDHIFTGLDTKARVTVTGSACWEANRREGGTAQAVLDLMSKYDDMPVPVRDLDTGEITEFLSKERFDSIGSAVFWACLDEVLHTKEEDLRKVFLTVVREPSKARVVTKGHAALKIVLDTVSKICSYPLKKGFRSSASGMGKSHHGWNLFKDMTSEEMYELLFTEDRKRRVEDTFHDHIDRVQYWEDVYLCSTDYQEATDRMVHRFARCISLKWMRKCGIPPILMGIVLGVCYKPRTVYFNGTGALSRIGREEYDDVRSVTLYRGVLMGDPLTKVVLHFANIIARRIGEGLASGDAFRQFRNAAACHESFLAGTREDVTSSVETTLVA